MHLFWGLTKKYISLRIWIIILYNFTKLLYYIKVFLSKTNVQYSYFSCLKKKCYLAFPMLNMKFWVTGTGEIFSTLVSLKQQNGDRGRVLFVELVILLFSLFWKIIWILQWNYLYSEHFLVLTEDIQQKIQKIIAALYVVDSSLLFAVLRNFQTAPLQAVLNVQAWVLHSLL